MRKRLETLLLTLLLLVGAIGCSDERAPHERGRASESDRTQAPKGSATRAQETTSTTSTAAAASSYQRNIMAPQKVPVAKGKSDHFPENPAERYTLGRALVELEANLKWSATEPAWAIRREAWIDETHQMKTFDQKKDLMLEFVGALKEEAMDNYWQTRKHSWKTDIEKHADNFKDLGIKLTEVEGRIDAQEFSEGWPKYRKSWVKKTQSLPN